MMNRFVVLVMFVSIIFAFTFSFRVKEVEKSRNTWRVVATTASETITKQVRMIGEYEKQIADLEAVLDNNRDVFNRCLIEIIKENPPPYMREDDIPQIVQPTLVLPQ